MGLVSLGQTSGTYVFASEKFYSTRPSSQSNLAQQQGVTQFQVGLLQILTNEPIKYKLTIISA
jgi:hypothetical protein